jgi:uncharacterized integral membrane protein
MENKRKDNTIAKLITSLVLLGLVSILVLQNAADQEITLFFWSKTMPLFVALFYSFILGILLALVLLFPKYRRTNKAEQKVYMLREKVSELETELSQLKKDTSKE